MIENSFSGGGTLRISLSEWRDTGEYRTDRIECNEGSFAGTVSAPATAIATITKWTAVNCSVFGPWGSDPAKVTILNLPTMEALADLQTVRLRKPPNDPFAIWIEYEEEVGNTCYAQVELESFNYRYSSEGSFNVLQGNARGSFSPEVNIPISSCLQGNTGNGAVAEVESKEEFIKPQFLVTDSTFAAPTIDDANKPPSSPNKTSAFFFAKVKPNGLTTTYTWEYGLSQSYTNKTSGTISSELTEWHGAGARVEGLQPGTTYHYRLIVSNAKGTASISDGTFLTPTWSLQATPNGIESGERGKYGNSLHGIGCEPASTNMCMAVGNSYSSGVRQVLAERWNGSSWALSSVVAPSGATSSRLEDVTCSSSTSCVAVGAFTTSSGTFSLVETWNGSGWVIQPSANVLGASETVLQGVSCSSTSSCMAVGYAINAGVFAHSAIAERWNGTAWSMLTVPVPSETSRSELQSVDCTSANFCMAVGGYLSAVWNGSSWALKTVAGPEGSGIGLHDVDCTGTAGTVCVAGGVASYSQPWKSVTLIDRWNGTQWAMQPSPNVGVARESEIEGVACSNAEATSCRAVGWWWPEISLDYSLAERWNGSAWSVEGTPNPFYIKSGQENIAYDTALTDIECRNSTCIAVGYSGNAWLEYVTVAQVIVDEPSKPSFSIRQASSASSAQATLSGTVTPNGLATQYHFEYGPTSSYGSNTPVPDGSLANNLFTPQSVSQSVTGLQSGATYHFRLVATNAEGTTTSADQTFTTPAAWSVQTTPNPSGASDSNLYDVSCEPSTSACTAVGKSTVSGADRPVAQRWNGTIWSEQTAAKKSGTLPTRLFGIDCPSEIRCLAAGNYQPTEGGPVLLAEIWNEGKWSVYSPPVPSEATSSELVGIGCNSTAQCRAAGSAVIKGVKTAIVEAWTSPTWTLMTVPIPEGASSSQLDGIDCIWSNVCVAVGRYTSSSGSVKKLAMLWNGTNWSLQTLAEPEGAVQTTLLDVSCTKSPTRCTAVGGWKNSAGEQFTLAYRFNGTTWTQQNNTPNPSGSIASVFQEVSCASETSCTAAGSWVSGSGGSNRTLAGDWNGSSWSIASSPNPLSASFSAFFGISCSGTTCMGAGWSTDGLGLDTTLAEAR